MLKLSRDRQRKLDDKSGGLTKGKPREWTTFYEGRGRKQALACSSWRWGKATL